MRSCVRVCVCVRAVTGGRVCDTDSVYARALLVLWRICSTLTNLLFAVAIFTVSRTNSARLQTGPVYAKFTVHLRSNQTKGSSLLKSGEKRLKKRAKSKETVGNSWTILKVIHFGSQILSQSLNEVHMIYQWQPKSATKRWFFFIYFCLWLFQVGVSDCKWRTKPMK